MGITSFILNITQNDRITKQERGIKTGDSIGDIIGPITANSISQDSDGPMINLGGYNINNNHINSVFLVS